jgi:hypothetical protein
VRRGLDVAARDDGKQARASTAIPNEDPPFANTANSGAPDPVELSASVHNMKRDLR